VSAHQYDGHHGAISGLIWPHKAEQVKLDIFDVAILQRKRMRIIL
jgi:hypothetical protein